MKKIIIPFLFIFIIILTGCPPKKTIKTEQQQPTITVHESKEPVSKAVEAKPEEKITEQKLAKIETEEEPIQYLEEEDVFEDIHFDFDVYEIRDDAKPILEKIASWLLKNTSAKILIEGHCDSRGTNEYNLALGDRRSKATRDYLIALGIAPNRIEMLSYGEEKPLCIDETEECWAQNRRAHFVVLKEAYK